MVRFCTGYIPQQRNMTSSRTSDLFRAPLHQGAPTRPSQTPTFAVNFRTPLGWPTYSFRQPVSSGQLPANGPGGLRPLPGPFSYHKRAVNTFLAFDFPTASFWLATSCSPRYSEGMAHVNHSELVASLSAFSAQSKKLRVMITMVNQNTAKRDKDMLDQVFGRMIDVETLIARFAKE